MTVNHSINFVDPETGTHTNKIEGLWKQAKEIFKQMNGCSRVHLNSYLNEFMFRNMLCSRRVDVFKKILETIATYYPAGGSGCEVFYEFEKTLKIDEFEIDLDDTSHGKKNILKKRL
jgi:hypothetical protein